MEQTAQPDRAGKVAELQSALCSTSFSNQLRSSMNQEEQAGVGRSSSATLLGAAPGPTSSPPPGEMSSLIKEGLDLIFSHQHGFSPA